MPLLSPLMGSDVLLVDHLGRLAECLEDGVGRTMFAGVPDMGGIKRGDWLQASGRILVTLMVFTLVHWESFKFEQFIFDVPAMSESRNAAACSLLSALCRAYLWCTLLPSSVPGAWFPCVRAECSVRLADIHLHCGIAVLSVMVCLGFKTKTAALALMTILQVSLLTAPCSLPPPS